MIEILSPVRDKISFLAAIEAGANAVYFGLGELNMRASSKGIEINDLDEIVKYAHSKNVKVYVTLNVIIFQNELKKIENILIRCKETNVDAIICWDFSVIKKCKELEIPFHISTQASVSNSVSANFYKDLGAKRIVLARECTIEQIREIKKKSKIEIEVFAHGAMCVSVSGRCFISQFLFCESANRGECYQPCRRSYKIIDNETGYELEIENHFVMSPKDLCTLPYLDKLVETKIDSLKIEGRSKSPEYISKVVKTYRSALEAIENNSFNEEFIIESMKNLSDVYNRGFSKGFLFGMPTIDDWTNIEGSAAKKRKEYIGKVVNYYPKSGTVWINIEKSNLSIGEVILIQGKTTGLKEMIIKELRVENEERESAGRGEATFPIDFKVRPNDQVYKIIKIKD